MIRDKSPSFDRDTRPDPAAQRLTGLDIQPLCLGSWVAAPILMHLAAARQGGAGGQGQRVAGAEFGQRRDRGAAAAFQRAQALAERREASSQSVVGGVTCGIVVAQIHVMAESY